MRRCARIRAGSGRRAATGSSTRASGSEHDDPYPAVITRGVYRLTENQRGRFRFTLDGNGWLRKGYRLVEPFGA